MTSTLFLLLPAVIVAIDAFVLLLARRAATRAQRIAFRAALLSLCLLPICALSALMLAANFLHGDTTTGIVFVASACGVVIGTLVALGQVFATAWRTRLQDA